MSGKKVLKIILIVILVALALFFINTFRKFMIIKDLQTKISEYSSSTNFHLKTIQNPMDNGKEGSIDYYKKDNKEVTILETISEEKPVKVSWYNNGERTDAFFEFAEPKSAQLDTDYISTVHIFNNLETENDFQTFLLSMIVKIKSAKYNDKECYIIKFENEQYYIDKETGLLLKNISNNVNVDREYEFNNVSDEIFIEPDIGQYQLIKNSNN